MWGWGWGGGRGRGGGGGVGGGWGGGGGGRRGCHEKTQGPGRPKQARAGTDHAALTQLIEDDTPEMMRKPFQFLSVQLLR